MEVKKILQNCLFQYVNSKVSKNTARTTEKLTCEFLKAMADFSNENLELIEDIKEVQKCLKTTKKTADVKKKETTEKLIELNKNNKNNKSNKINKNKSKVINKYIICNICHTPTLAEEVGEDGVCLYCR